MTQYQIQVLNTLVSSKNSNKKDLFNSIYVFQNSENIITDIIFDAVMALSEGFVVDICKNAVAKKQGGKKDCLSEKQAWCIVYAYIKISDEALAEWYKNYTSHEGEEVEEADKIYAGGEDVKPSKEVRCWHYNADHHILNIHYTDGTTLAVVAHPKKMREVFSARKAGNKVTENDLVKQLANACPRPAKRTLTAEEERLSLLKQKFNLGILPADEIEQYHKLVYKILL